MKRLSCMHDSYSQSVLKSEIPLFSTEKLFKHSDSPLEGVIFNNFLGGHAPRPALKPGQVIRVTFGLQIIRV